MFYTILVSWASSSTFVSHSFFAFILFQNCESCVLYHYVRKSTAPLHIPCSCCTSPQHLVSTFVHPSLHTQASEIILVWLSSDLKYLFCPRFGLVLFLYLWGRPQYLFAQMQCLSLCSYDWCCWEDQISWLRFISDFCKIHKLIICTYSCEALSTGVFTSHCVNRHVGEVRCNENCFTVISSDSNYRCLATPRYCSPFRVHWLHFSRGLNSFDRSSLVHTFKSQLGKCVNEICKASKPGCFARYWVMACHMFGFHSSIDGNISELTDYTIIGFLVPTVSIKYVKKHYILSEFAQVGIHYIRVERIVRYLLQS